MQSHSLSLSDHHSLHTLNTRGSRILHPSALKGQDTLIRLGLATLDGLVLTITDKGREWCEPYHGPNGEPF